MLVDESVSLSTSRAPVDESAVDELDVLLLTTDYRWQSELGQVHEIVPLTLGSVYGLVPMLYAESAYIGASLHHSHGR